MSVSLSLAIIAKFNISIHFIGCSCTATCPWGSGTSTSGPSCLAAITRKQSEDHRWSAQCQMEHQARGTVPDPVQPPGRAANRAYTRKRRRGERWQPNREPWWPVFGRSASVWYCAWGWWCQGAWQGKAKTLVSVNRKIFYKITNKCSSRNSIYSFIHIRNLNTPACLWYCYF